MTFYEAFDEYNEKFPDGFPTIPLLNRGEAWCINVIGEFGHGQRTISHISRHYGKNELQRRYQRSHVEQSYYDAGKDRCAKN